MKNYRYALEIGGAYTRVFVKDEGLALCEPTLVAAEPSPEGYKVVGLGKNAKKMMGKTSDSVEVFNPMSNGKISNYEYLKELLTYFFAKLDFKKNRDSVILLINCGINKEEKELFMSLLFEMGFKDVVLIPTVICSCIGAGKNISSTKTNMMINIGGTSTDIAVVNMNSIVKGATLGLGGKAVDVAIANTIAYNHGIVVGLGTSEKL